MAATHTVLVIDDSPTAGPELRALLESEGYHVVSALRAEEGLDTLRHSKVDLVITEALLPGMDGFELVRQIRRHEDWSHIPVIILTVRSAPEDYAASYEAGADEYFLKPMEPPKILAATRGLITRYEAARADTQQGGALQLVGRRRRGLAPAPATTSARFERGRIITVFSLKGGVGTSTIAVNLAVGIKHLAPSARVGLIDLSLEEGSDALFLDVVPTSTIFDWAREDLSEATPDLLHQYFVTHRSGISLLAAPPSPEQAETVRPDVVRLTTELAPETFDYVVLDTAHTFSESSLIALEAAESIVLPVIADMAALRTASNTLRILKAVRIGEEKIHIVLNELIPKAGLTVEQVQTSLGKQVHVIPHAGTHLMDAVNQGMPVVAQERPSPVSRSLMGLSRLLCEPEEIEQDQANKARSGLLGRLRTRNP